MTLMTVLLVALDLVKISTPYIFVKKKNSRVKMIYLHHLKMMVDLKSNLFALDGFWELW